MTLHGRAGARRQNPKVEPDDGTGAAAAAVVALSVELRARV